MHVMRSALLGLVIVLVAAAPAAAHEAHASSAVKRAPAKAFGPWDAGQVRAVKRGGQEGRARREHPLVGDAAKVPASGPPAPPLRIDPDLPELALSRGNAVGSSLSANPLYLAALLYSGFITKVDGPRCSHYPTCSRFANQAVARHGFIGVLLGLERVIVDDNSSSVRRLPEIDMPSEPQPRFYDPVDNYEFWIPGRMSAFPEAMPEEPLELSQAASASNDDAAARRHDDVHAGVRTKRLPKCPNARTLRAPDDEDEDRCEPDRS